MSVGERLKKLRGQRRREVVAAETGISVSALAMYENGLRTPRDETKRKLAAYYNTTVQAIFFNSECHEL